MIFSLFRRSSNTAVIGRLHGEIMAAVRQPVIYADWHVPDTFEGRFEILSLLATLIVRRLAQLPAPAAELSQDLTDRIFSEVDAAMREMGVGDLAVPKRIKKLASGFLGRRQAYDAALNAGDVALLSEALSRNVYGMEPTEGAQQALPLARYAFRLDKALGVQALESFTKGPLHLPAAEAENQL
jgi:cytochrome b pre-mRNA-processing protein 3